MEELKGKIALVSGGGRGLGEAICRELGAAGVTVLAADVREELVTRLAQDMAATGCKAAGIKLDVGDEMQVQRTIRNAVDTYGRLDVLINNAGVDMTVPIEEMLPDDWDRILRVNLRGPFLMSKYGLAVMKQQGAGHIINITSTAAKRAWANASAYHASKWGLLGFSHALHVEARPANVKVTAIVCGGMRTPFLLERFPDIDQNNLQDPKNVAAAVRFVLTQPKETVIPEMMVLPMRETSWP
jgi:NAD(P)-dependent dehydrogenase (short-subunit alcohol dehydrogenase family)